MAANSWTDENDRRLLELHAEGKTQAVVAQALGVSRQTVNKHSKRLGVVWNGARIKTGAQVKQAQLSERRLTLAERLTSLAEKRLKALEADTYRDLVKAEYGAEATAELPYIPSRSMKDEMAAMKALVSSVKELKALEDLNNGGSAVDGWLGFMAAGEVRLKIMAQQGITEDQNTQTGD